MADNKTQLPEGTDKVIAGASTTDSANAGPGNVDGGAIGGSISGTRAIGSGPGAEEALTETGAGTAPEAMGGTGRGGTAATVAETASPTDTATTRGKVMDKVRSGTDKLSGQAADKARGLVGQGIERSAEALANVSRLVGDTATGLDERLGQEYGDYARRAAEAIDGAANSLAVKDADELIDDTREFVRKSPGVALAGAAIVGFALARLLKSGLSSDRNGRRDEDA